MKTNKENTPIRRTVSLIENTAGLFYMIPECTDDYFTHTWVACIHDATPVGPSRTEPEPSDHKWLANSLSYDDKNPPMKDLEGAKFVQFEVTYTRLNEDD